MDYHKTILILSIISIMILQIHSFVTELYTNDSNDSEGVAQYFNDLQINQNHSSIEPPISIETHIKSKPNPDNHGNKDHSNPKINYHVNPHQHLKGVVNINNNNNSPSKHHPTYNVNQHSSGFGHNFTTNEPSISIMAGNNDSKKDRFSHNFNHIISDSHYQLEYYDPVFAGVYGHNDKECTFKDDYCPFGKENIHKIRWDNHLKHLTKIHHRCENLFPLGPFRFHVCCETFEIMIISNLIEMTANLLDKECPPCFETYRKILCKMATSIVAEKLTQPLPGPTKVKMISQELFKADQKVHEMGPQHHHHHIFHRTHHHDPNRYEDGSMADHKQK